MLQIVIFSYNRAMQLDTLLNSLFRNWRKPISFQVDVVYNHSNEKFGAGYRQLIAAYSREKVKFYKEDACRPDKISIKEKLNFLNIARLYRNERLRHPKTDFRSLTNRVISESSCKNIMFLTDDCKFVSPVSIPSDVFSWVNSRPNRHQFSLRLSKERLSQPVSFVENCGYWEWDIYKYAGDWGYPFSVDGHIYNKDAVLSLLKKYLYINPNTLEAYVLGAVRKKHLFSKGRCFETNKVQTFPINIVQNEIINGNQNVSVEMLNSHYLNGERLDYIADRQLSDAKQHVEALLFTGQNGRAIQVPIK